MGVCEIAMIGEFQFLIGSLISLLLLTSATLLGGFQFLIGSLISSVMTLWDYLMYLMFQFLIGSLIS